MTPQGSSRQGGGRRLMVAALVVVALLGATLLVISLTGQVGDPPQPELRSQGPEVSDGGSAEPSAVPSTAAEEPDEEPQIAEPDPTEGAAAPVAPLERSEPTSMTIPSIGVDEELFPIGLGQNGELLAPQGDRANQPAWFDGSPTPGENGPSVIEGHVTWHGDPSVFFELGGLAPGDRIDVEREDGTTATFEVYDSARYPKDEFPTLAVYGRTDGPELRVITCGGDLDADGHHLDNTVVFARLVQN
ncbi:MAG: class F sortase [Brachybacterium tyrofermentans]